MPLPLIPLAIGAAQALPKLWQAFTQNSAIDNVKLQDSRPESFKEKLAMSRQAANTARLPGQSYQENRLAQGQAGAVQNARLGAASSSDFLASAGAADARRQQGEQQLGIQGLQYQDQSKQRLGQALDQDAAYRTADLNNYNREKAALTQGAAENLNNAVGGAAGYAALAYNMGQDGGMASQGGAFDGARTPALDMSGGVGPYTPPPAQLPYYQGANGAPNLNRYRYVLGGGRYANRSQRYGF